MMALLPWGIVRRQTIAGFSQRWRSERTKWNQARSQWENPEKVHKGVEYAKA